MAYKAIIAIGDYKIGDVVLDEQAEEWLSMYKYPPVEKAEDTEAPKAEPKKKDSKSPSVPKTDVWMDDYLARNEWVVKKALKKDKHTQGTLSKLYDLEKESKKRKGVLSEIKKLMEA